MLEIKNAVVAVVLIFLKHNGLSGQVISSSQLCSGSIPCMNFYANEGLLYAFTQCKLCVFGTAMADFQTSNILEDLSSIWVDECFKHLYFGSVWVAISV